MKNFIIILIIATLFTSCKSVQEKQVIEQVVSPCIDECSDSESYEDCMKDCLKRNAELLVIDEVIEEITGGY